MSVLQEHRSLLQGNHRQKLIGPDVTNRKIVLDLEHSLDQVQVLTGQPAETAIRLIVSTLTPIPCATSERGSNMGKITCTLSLAFNKA